jgi:hypothetical protein
MVTKLRISYNQFLTVADLVHFVQLPNLRVFESDLALKDFPSPWPVQSTTLHTLHTVANQPIETSSPYESRRLARYIHVAPACRGFTSGSLLKVLGASAVHKPALRGQGEWTGIWYDKDTGSVITSPQRGDRSSQGESVAGRIAALSNVSSFLLVRDMMALLPLLPDPNYLFRFPDNQ